MYVARVPNRGSPPAILLRESYREGGAVKTRTLANLTRWPEAKVDALAQVLKGRPPQLDLTEAFEITRSLPHGHVAAVAGTAARLGMAELIDPAPSRTRDLVSAMLVAPARWGRCSACRVPTRTTCMRRWIGRWPAKTASKSGWPPGI